MQKIQINKRCLSHPITGVQRYLSQILQYLSPESYNAISAGRFGKGMSGHLWEQFMLPILTSNALLWSPANTGPIVHKNHIITIHDCSTIDHPEWFSSSFSKLYNFILPKVAKSSRKIITVSEFSKSRLIHHFNINPDKIFVTPLSGQTHVISHSDVLRHNVPFQLNGLGTHGFFLAVGSIEPRKNLEGIINAFLAMKKQVGIKLVIVGEVGPSIRFKSVNIMSDPDIILTGRITDHQLNQLYSNCIAFVYPSYYEGFGLPILEAMNAGAAVITSNNGALAEISAGHAFLVDPYSQADISNALLKLSNDSSFRSSLALSGKHHSSKFTWENTAELTMNILKND